MPALAAQPRVVALEGAGELRRPVEQADAVLQVVADQQALGDVAPLGEAEAVGALGVGTAFPSAQSSRIVFSVGSVPDALSVVSAITLSLTTHQPALIARNSEQSLNARGNGREA